MTGSWLNLERYALGECDAGEARQIEALLVSDPDARAMLRTIHEDRRVLGPLPIRRRTPYLAVGALLLAAAALLVVRPGEDGAVKGGAASVELVRLQDGLVTAIGSELAVGDRLGLRLSCAPGRTAVDVVVFHGGEAAFPMARTTVHCANGVPIPGAFSVDAPGPLVACVAIGDPPPREILATGPHAADVCVEAEAHW